MWNRWLILRLWKWMGKFHRPHWTEINRVHITHYLPQSVSHTPVTRTLNVEFRILGCSRCFVILGTSVLVESYHIMTDIQIMSGDCSWEERIQACKRPRDLNAAALGNLSERSDRFPRNRTVGFPKQNGRFSGNLSSGFLETNGFFSGKYIRWVTH